MAPFVYPTYENRMAGSIGDILARRGEIAAAAAQRAGVILSNSTRQIGDIHARAQEQQGQAWGQAVGGAVQAAGQVPQQAAALQAQDVQRKGQQLELEAKLRAADDLKALDAAYAQPGGRDAILKALQDGGRGHLIPGVSKTFTEFDKAHAEAQKLQEEADAAKVGAFARAGMMVREHGYDPQSAMIMIADLKQKYASDPASLSKVKEAEAALLKNPAPETVKAIIDPYLQADPKTREDLAKAAADAETAKNHGLEHADRAAAAAATAARDAQTKKDEDARRELEERRIRDQEERTRIERINAGTASTREKREHDIYVQTYGEPSKNPDGTPAPVPVSATAKAIAEYKMQAPSPRSRQQGPGKAQMEQVLAYNPSYDETQYATRAALRRAYTSGNQSQQLGSLNTAIEHLGLLDEMAKALGNGSFKPGNKLWNDVATAFGSSRATNFDFAKDIMSGELATAMKKSGATDVEIEKVSRALSSANSPQQLGDAIRTVAVPMIGGKASTMEQQYHAVMGEKDPFSVYTPGAKSVLERFGAGKMIGAPPAPAAGGGGKGGGPGVVAPGPKEGETKPITEPGYPPGAEMTFRGGKWIRTK